ncbi:MAG: hypothetical protein AB7N71_08570 [Phycisphaerae bacterium]
MKRVLLSIVLTSSVALLFAGCTKETQQQPQTGANTTADKDSGAQSHAHADGSTHDDHADTEGTEGDADHSHDEAPLGTVEIGGMKVELAQGHGKIEAGKEGHLVVKLPYNDNGETIVRAWIGTEDRTLSLVGKGEYAPSHDDYDIHAVAPDPLPENVMWWVEIQKPDGEKKLGSIQPLR